MFAIASASNDARIPAAEMARAPVAPATAVPGAVAQPGAVKPAQGEAAATSAVAAAPQPPPSPLDVYTVGSWWKMGAGRESLEANMAECVKDLGDVHQPIAKTQRVTRGLVMCLRDKGWKALLEK